MSAIKDGRYPITLDRERHLLFSLNVMDEVQDRFGSLDVLPEMLSGKGTIKNLRWLLTALINEGKDDNDEDLTERQVGRLIHAGNFKQLQTSVLSAFSVGTRGTDKPPDDESDEDDGDDDTVPNATAGEVQ